jgi:hypothetical protein
MISALLSATGKCSISPNRKSTLVVPIFTAFFLALEIISGVMSTPMTWPVLPICSAETPGGTQPQESDRFVSVEGSGGLQQDAAGLDPIVTSPALATFP